MIRRFYRKHRADLARRCVALAALASFAAGNVGWPQSPEKTADQAGERGCCGRLVKLAGPAGCCCGRNAKKSSCGCCKRPAVAKTSGCCQRKQAAGTNSHVPALTCHCGDSTIAGFFVSSQPKLQAPSVEVPQPAETSANVPRSSLGGPQGALPPETPPPRPSAA